MSRTLKLFMILTLWVFGPAWQSSALALHQIQNIRHWVAPDHTRVVIDTTGDVRFTVEKGDRTLAVDLEDTAFPSGIPHLTVLNKPGVEGIAVSPPTQFRGTRRALSPRSRADDGVQAEEISG